MNLTKNGAPQKARYQKVLRRHLLVSLSAPTFAQKTSQSGGTRGHQQEMEEEGRTERKGEMEEAGGGEITVLIIPLP